MALISRILIALGGGAGLARELQDRLASDLAPRQSSGWLRLAEVLNRLPPPLMALATLILAGAAIIAPEWFDARLAALAQAPEALWWLIGAVVSLSFGAGFQASAQDLAREIIAGAPPPDPLANAATGADSALTLAVETPAENPALDDWRAKA